MRLEVSCKLTPSVLEMSGTGTPSPPNVSSPTVSDGPQSRCVWVRCSCRFSSTRALARDRHACASDCAAVNVSSPASSALVHAMIMLRSWKALTWLMPTWMLRAHSCRVSSTAHSMASMSGASSLLSLLGLWSAADGRDEISRGKWTWTGAGDCGGGAGENAAWGCRYLSSSRVMQCTA